MAVVIPSYSTGSGVMPASDGFTITTSDTVNFTAGMARALYIGATGNVVLITPQGTVLTFVGLAAGAILPVMCTRVNATNTTASSLVGLI